MRPNSFANELVGLAAVVGVVEGVAVVGPPHKEQGPVVHLLPFSLYILASVNYTTIPFHLAIS